MTEADKILQELGLLDQDEDVVVDDDTKTDPNDESKSVPPTEDKTKAYSERLKKEREKMKSELASSLGFESWEAAIESKQNKTLEDKGFDPETVKPLLKEMLEQDPTYKEAVEYKKQKEALEKKVWADGQIKQLNEKFGLGLKSVKDLDENTLKLWNDGLSLDKAYAAEHFDEIVSKNKQLPIDNGKQHLVNPANGSPDDSSKQVKPNKELVEMFRKLNPGVTDDQINKYLNK